MGFQWLSRGNPWRAARIRPLFVYCQPTSLVCISQSGVRRRARNACRSGIYSLYNILLLFGSVIVASVINNDNNNYNKTTICKEQ